MDERALKRQRAAGEGAENEDGSNSFSSTSSLPSSVLSASSAWQVTSFQSSSPSASLAEVLTTLNLSQFQGEFLSEGYETKADLAELTPVQAEQVCTAIGIKSGHKIRFCRWIREQYTGSSSVEAPTAVGTETVEQTQIVGIAPASMATVLAELEKWKAVAEKNTEHRLVAAVQVAERRAAASTTALAAAEQGMATAEQKVAVMQASMRCPITHEPMADPVICVDGQTYERSAIEQWFSTGAATSPATGGVLTSRNLVPVIALRSAIHEFFPEACERFKTEVERRRAGELAALNAPVDSSGRTQLFVAAESNQVGRVRELLAARAAVDQATNDEHGGEAPLYIAAQNGHEEVVSLLLGAGASINQAATEDGTTPLYIAAQNGYAEVVSLLLGGGADVNQAMTDDGTTPLFIAAQNGQTQVVRLLLGGGADVNQAMTDDGATPLFIATNYGHEQVVSLLLGVGADTNQATTDHGTTPLYVAAQKGHAELVSLLLGAGADTNQATIDNGATPLY